MLKLSVRVGESVRIGGPATLRVDRKSGQVVGLAFDADSSVAIDLIPQSEKTAPTPRGVSLGLGQGPVPRK